MTGTEFQHWCQHKRSLWGADRWDPDDLVSRFVPFFHTERRICVQDQGTGRKRYGRVGVTTGWKPAFLLMHRSNALSSYDLLGPQDRITAIRDESGHRYIPVNPPL